MEGKEKLKEKKGKKKVERKILVFRDNQWVTNDNRCEENMKIHDQHN